MLSTGAGVSFGTRLREERKRVGKTQAEMAKIAGVTTRSLISWEKDEASPNSIALAKLALEEVDIYITFFKVSECPAHLAARRCLICMNGQTMEAQLSMRAE